MRIRWHPQPTLAVLHARVLAAQIDALARVAGFLVTALREGAGAGGELGGDGGVGRDPVCEGVFTFLDDTGRGELVDAFPKRVFEEQRCLRFAGLVPVVRVAGFSWSDRGIVDQLQQVLSVTGDDGDFLAVLAESVELVGKCRL